MPEDVRQELRELYMGRVDTYPYFYYPVRRRGGMRDMDRPLPPDLVDPNPREYLRWKGIIVLFGTSGGSKEEHPPTAKCPNYGTTGDRHATNM